MPASAGRWRSALDIAESTFQLLNAGPRPLGLDCRRFGFGVPKRTVPLVELRQILLQDSIELAAQDAVWRKLVWQARWGTSREAWLIGCAGMAMPGLKNVAARLARGYRGDVEDLDSTVLEEFCVQVRTADLRLRYVGPRLLWAAYGAGAQLRLGRRDYLSVAPEDLRHIASPEPVGHPDLLLDQAVQQGVLSREQADLLGLAHLDDLRGRPLAKQLGRTRPQVRYALRKAEQCLLRHLTDHL
ncbi:hypothetical protein D5S17_14555 [Pseudonocardiaceae bacterium YIM PH 21723]|nr:hypothetical protein D5S17_14555 [Pseudonocardiaceae bacterium YIM PH 21723]